LNKKKQEKKNKQGENRGRKKEKGRENGVKAWHGKKELGGRKAKKKV